MNQERPSLPLPVPAALEDGATRSTKFPTSEQRISQSRPDAVTSHDRPRIARVPKVGTSTGLPVASVSATIPLRNSNPPHVADTAPPPYQPHI
ncbi:hypothetical protein HGRIS_002969 [Hohenbuehelia grisea]|uniref:Uncharacterized protein n=1 Tax=Hohenbuehelia grisea TaxID=104357 RepID=A0ABR3JP82_9AGAR